MIPWVDQVRGFISHSKCSHRWRKCIINNRSRKLLVTRDSKQGAPYHRTQWAAFEELNNTRRHFKQKPKALPTRCKGEPNTTPNSNRSPADVARIETTPTVYQIRGLIHDCTEECPMGASCWMLCWSHCLDSVKPTRCYISNIEE